MKTQSSALTNFPFCVLCWNFTGKHHDWETWTRLLKRSPNKFIQLNTGRGITMQIYYLIIWKWKFCHFAWPVRLKEECVTWRVPSWRNHFQFLTAWLVCSSDIWKGHRNFAQFTLPSLINSFPSKTIWKTGLRLICLWMLNNAGFILCEAKVKEEPGEREEQPCAERLEMNCQESSQDSCTFLEDMQPWDASEKHRMLGYLWPKRRRRRRRWAQRGDHCLDLRIDALIFTKHRKALMFSRSCMYAKPIYLN